ncbi:MAG: hypothetical protein WBZ11_13420 [Candidatus Sulfotelmatobacter sp.]
MNGKFYKSLTASPGYRHRPLTLFRHKSQADAVPIRPKTNDQ